MTTACHKKCVIPRYKDSELTKGESVCIDRCVAKYMDVNYFVLFKSQFLFIYLFRFMIVLVNI